VARTSRRRGVTAGQGGEPLTGGQLTVLLIEPRDAAAARVRRMLMSAGPGFALEHVRTLEDARARLRERPFDAVLVDAALAADISIPDDSSSEPAIIVLGDEPARDARAAGIQGAQDYLALPELVPGMLVRSIRAAVERHELLSELHARIREAEANAAAFRTIFSTTADAIVVVDQDGVVRLANPAAEQLFGKPADALVGKPLGFPVVVGETTEVE